MVSIDIFLYFASGVHGCMQVVFMNIFSVHGYLSVVSMDVCLWCPWMFVSGVHGYMLVVISVHGYIWQSCSCQWPGQMIY